MPGEKLKVDGPLLEVKDLCKVFSSPSLLLKSQVVVAARDISFSVRRGEALAVVGESGSGKSTVAKALLRLVEPDGGEILFDGVNLLSRQPQHASLSYRRRVQAVFQDPFGSLNPAHTIAQHLVRPLRRHRRAAMAEARSKAIDLLRTVGLEPAEDFAGRRLDELTSGQPQRVAIARALAVDPDLLVVDEPTSMLDVSIRMDILTLLKRLMRQRKMAVMLITRDLASARYLADRVLVLFRGRIVEDGPAEAIVATPAHPYTRELVGSIAHTSAMNTAGDDRRDSAEDEPAVGCPFAPRCSDVHDICREIDPAYIPVENRRVRCHLYSQAVELTGS